MYAQSDFMHWKDKPIFSSCIFKQVFPLSLELPHWSKSSCLGDKMSYLGGRREKCCQKSTCAESSEACQSVLSDESSWKSRSMRKVLTSGPAPCLSLLSRAISLAILGRKRLCAASADVMTRKSCCSVLRSVKNGCLTKRRASSVLREVSSQVRTETSWRGRLWLTRTSLVGVWP